MGGTAAAMEGELWSWLEDKSCCASSPFLGAQHGQGSGIPLQPSCSPQTRGRWGRFGHGYGRGLGDFGPSSHAVAEELHVPKGTVLSHTLPCFPQGPAPARGDIQLGRFPDVPSWQSCPLWLLTHGSQLQGPRALLLREIHPSLAGRGSAGENGVGS